MRGRLVTLGLSWIAAGCLGPKDPATEGVEARLDDACFSEGRAVGLEHAPDECALRLPALDTTGVFEQTLEGCEEGVTRWRDLQVDADVPDGASVAVAYRTSDDLFVPVGALMWTPLEDAPPELEARFLEVRVELRAPAGDARPALRGVSVARVCGDP